MDQNKLDKIFKEGLENHTSAVNSQALWQAIRDDVPRQKPPFMRLLSLGFVIGMVVASLVWYMNSSPQTLSSTLSKSTLAAPATQSNTQEVFSSAPKEIETKIAEKINTLKNTEIQASQRNEADINQQSRTAIKLAPSAATSPTTATHRTNKYKATENNIINTPANPNSLPTFTSSHKATQLRQNVETNNTFLSTTNHNSNTQKLLKSSITKLQAVQAVQPSILAYSEPQTYLSTMKLTPNKEVECYDYNKKKGIFSVELYGLVDYVYNRLSTSEEMEPYLLERKKSQTQLEGYRSGLRFKYSLPSGLYLKSGIEAGVIRERFRVSVFEERMEILPNQLLEIIEQGDSTIYIYGNKEVTIESEKRWRVENSYRSLGVPVLLGYEFQVGKMFLGIEGGAIYNLKYDFKGYLLDNDTGPIDDPDFFKPV